MESYKLVFEKLNEILEYVSNMKYQSDHDLPPFLDKDKRGVHLFKEYARLPSIFSPDDEFDIIKFTRQRVLSELYFQFLTKNLINDDQLITFFTLCLQELDETIVQAKEMSINTKRIIVEVLNKMDHCVPILNLYRLKCHIKDIFPIIYVNGTPLGENYKMSLILDDMRKLYKIVSNLENHERLWSFMIHDTMDMIKTTLNRQRLILLRYQYSHVHIPPIVEQSSPQSVNEDTDENDAPWEEIRWDYISYPEIENEQPDNSPEVEDHVDQEEEFELNEPDADSELYMGFLLQILEDKKDDPDKAASAA